jgi:hypothetical protein
VGLNFIFKILCSTLIFSNFFQNFISKLYAEYFLFQYFLQNLSFLFSLFYKFDHMSFLVYNFSIQIFYI